jgi:hypothetical protein
LISPYSLKEGVLFGSLWTKPYFSAAYFALLGSARKGNTTLIITY